MASEWFYTRDGEGKSGPVAPAQLQALANSGELKPTDKVWKEGMAQWMPANSIRGLIPSAGSAVPSKKPATASQRTGMDRPIPLPISGTHRSRISDDDAEPSEERGGRGKLIAIVAVAAIAFVVLVAGIGGAIVIGVVLHNRSNNAEKTLAENKKKPLAGQVAEEKKESPTEQPMDKGSEKKADRPNDENPPTEEVKKEDPRINLVEKEDPRKEQPKVEQGPMENVVKKEDLKKEQPEKPHNKDSALLPLELNKEQKALVYLTDTKTDKFLKLASGTISSLNSKQVRFSSLAGLFNNGSLQNSCQATYTIAENKFVRENFRPPTFQGNPIYPPGSPVLENEWPHVACKLIFVENDTYFYDSAQRYVSISAIDGQLTRDDPRDKLHTACCCQMHDCVMEAGQTYRIDMVSKDFDTRLRLENSAGKKVAETTQFGHATHIDYVPSEKETYRIIATSSKTGFGNYSLKVRIAKSTGGQQGFFSVNALSGDKDDVSLNVANRATLILSEGFPKRNGPRPPAQVVHVEIAAINSKQVVFRPDGLQDWIGANGMAAPKEITTWDASGIRAVLISGGDTLVYNLERKAFVSLKALRMKLDAAASNKPE